MYYYVRNRFFILQAKYSNKFIAIINYLFFVAAFAGLIVFFQKTDRRRKLNFIVWPMADAIKNNFNATPPLILGKLQEQYEKSYASLLLTPFKNFISHLFTPSLNEGSKPATA